MDFKQLEYFKTIYEEGSISKAAEKLYISQQGLSKAVLALEKELDCRLFERSSKGIQLTEPGEALLVHAERLLEERDTILRDMAGYREHEKLSVHMVIGSRFSLPKECFKRFLDCHPHMELDVQELKNEACLYNLEHGKADVAVVISPVLEKGYECLPIKKERITLVMPKEHELAVKKEISVTELDGTRIVYHSGSSSAVVIEQCEKRGIRFSKMIEVPGMVALYQTCSAMGIPGISLESLDGKMAFPNLVSVPVSEEEVAWDITLVYHESMKKVKLVMEFVNYLKERLLDEDTDSLSEMI